MKDKTRKAEKTSESISFFFGLVGLVAVLFAGVWVPLKLAEVMFGYSLSDAFWQVTETTASDDSEDDVQRSRR